MIKPDKLRSVESARGIAAMLVVLAHAGTLLAGPRDFGTVPLWGALHFGYAGVDFFFVLSGFIICYVHAGDIGNPARLGRYGWRRFVRIYPLYWTVLALYGLLLAVSPSREGYERDPLSIATSVLLLPHPAHDPILGVAWTLQHEALFYVLFATLILHRRLGLGLFAAWLALIAIAAIAPAAGGAALPWPLGFAASFYNAEFFVGMLVALLLRRDLDPPGGPLPWLVCGALLFVGTGLFDDWGPGVSVHAVPLRAAYAIGAGMVLYGLAGAERAGRKLLVSAPMVGIGAASYSIYLVHIIVLMILQQGIRAARHVVPLPLDLTWLSAVAATVALAVLFSRTVERPLLRRCRSMAPRLAVAG